MYTREALTEILSDLCFMNHDNDNNVSDSEFKAI